MSRSRRPITIASLNLLSALLMVMILTNPSNSLDSRRFIHSAVANSGMSTAFYVSPAGSDAADGSASAPWATIQHAADAARPGTIIHVAPGRYVEAIKTTASGTSDARITFVSDVRWGAKIIAPNSDSAWENRGDYVDISGFDITGVPPVRIGIHNGGSHVRVIGNRIHDIVADCSVGGQAVDHSNYNAVYNDTIGNLLYNIRVASTCTTVHGYGIYHAMYGGKIANNIVFNNGSHGIHLWHAANNVIISSNTIFNNGRAGILIGDGDSPGGVVVDHTVVANNILYKNGIGLWEFCYSGQTCIGSNNQYLHNLIYLNGTNMMFLFGHVDSGRVSADPQFVNYTGYSSGDYHLKSTSPAIDKGTSLDAPLNDFDGSVRPQGSGWDIGAYESGSTAPAWPWE